MWAWLCLRCCSPGAWGNDQNVPASQMALPWADLACRQTLRADPGSSRSGCLHWFLWQCVQEKNVFEGWECLEGTRDPALARNARTHEGKCPGASGPALLTPEPQWNLALLWTPWGVGCKGSIPPCTQLGGPAVRDSQRGSFDSGSSPAQKPSRGKSPALLSWGAERREVSL